MIEIGKNLSDLLMTLLLMAGVGFGVYLNHRERMLKLRNETCSCCETDETIEDSE